MLSRLNQMRWKSPEKVSEPLETHKTFGLAGSKS